MSEVILSQNLSGFSSTKFGAVLLPPIIIIHLEGSSHLSSLFGVKPPMNLSVSDVFFFFSACLSFAPLSSFSLVHPLFFFFTFPPPTSTRLSSTPFLVLFLKSSFPLPLFTLWSAPVIYKSSVPPTSRFSLTSF